MKKVPRKNLPKEVKDMCSEADKTLMKEIKMTQTGGDIYHALRLEESVLWKWLYYSKQSTDAMQSLSNYHWILAHRIRTKDSTVCMETWKTGTA